MTNKAELEKAAALRKAKEQWLKDHPDGKSSNTNNHDITGHKGGEVRVTDEGLPENPVLYLKNNKNTRFLIDASKIVKLNVESCTNCVIVQTRCIILTGTVEIWSSKEVSYSTDTHVGTLQLDMCKSVSVSLKEPSHLGQMVQAAVKKVSVKFTEQPQHDFELTWEKLKEEYDQELKDNDKTTQFISRFVEGKILTEKVVRLLNDYPSTQREAKKYQCDSLATRMMIEELEHKVKSTHTPLSPEEQAKLEHLRKELAQHITGGEELSAEARALAKKMHGNEEFKEGNVPQAMVYYTESLTLFPVTAVYANRAECFIQLKQFDKALDDCEECLKMEPNYIKAHFRKGLALMQLERFKEAGMSFARTLELEPNNKAAKSSMEMARMRLMKELKGDKMNKERS